MAACMFWQFAKPTGCASKGNFNAHVYDTDGS
jgi:hypothetical protein